MPRSTSMRRAGMRLTPTATGACLVLLLPLTGCGRQAAPPPAPPSQAATQSAPVSPAAASTLAASSAPPSIASAAPRPASQVKLQEYDVPKGEHPHDVAPTAD